jgi:hypothetical protein
MAKRRLYSVKYLYMFCPSINFSSIIRCNPRVQTITYAHYLLLMLVLPLLLFHIIFVDVSCWLLFISSVPQVAPLFIVIPLVRYLNAINLGFVGSYRLLQLFHHERLGRKGHSL